MSSVCTTVYNNFPSLTTIMITSTEVFLAAVAICTFGLIGYIAWKMFKAFLAGILFFILFTGGSLVLLDFAAFDGAHLASALDFCIGPITNTDNENPNGMDNHRRKGGDIPSYMQSIP
jgi:hypothetical protein